MSCKLFFASIPGIICIGICFSANPRKTSPEPVRMMGITMESIDEARGHTPRNAGCSIESAERHFPYYFCFHCKQGSVASGR